MPDRASQPTMPIPTSVSEAAQVYLATPEPFGNSRAPEDPTDTDAWVRYIEQMNEVVIARLGGMSVSDLPIDVETMTLEGVPTYVARPADASDRTPIYLDIHGGALILLGGEICKFAAGGGALRRDMITWAIDYRMPPAFPYPAALDDCMAVYRRALEERAPEDIFVGGGSAGGNLAAALLLRAKDEGLPMPAGLVLISPEVDLTESGDTFRTMQGGSMPSSLMSTNLLYANGHDLAHPYLSPLFGDVTGFPPTFLQSGTRDHFLSNTVRMHRTLLAAGVVAELHIWEAMPHGGFGGVTPEDAEVQAQVQQFLERNRRDRD